MDGPLQCIEIPSAYAGEPIHCSRKASYPLNIFVIGCGVGGLSAAYCLSEAGHIVTILESARTISDVGAGVQISPNASRLLARWGIGDELSKWGIEPDGVKFIRYNNGESIGYRYFDLHSILLARATSSSRVTLKLASKVTEVYPSPKPDVSVKLASGEILSGDLIIGADGLKSITRNAVVGHSDDVEPTGDAAYRAVIKTDVMEMEDDVKALVEGQETTVWIGPRKHIVGYCIRAKREYNLVMVHPDKDTVETWNPEGNLEKMRQEFKDFEPRVRKILSLVRTSMKWQLMERGPLESWVHSDGRLVLLGDSCHPMLPYHAQGAAMAIEDAAVLGSLLSRLSRLSDLHFLMRAYEHLRKERTTKTQAASRDNRHLFHLPDGPVQLARDAKLRKSMELELQRKYEIRTVHSESGMSAEITPNENNNFITEQYAYDAEEEAERWWVLESKVD